MPDEVKQNNGLPSSVATPRQVSLISRELSALDEQLSQDELKGQKSDLKVKDISSDLHEFLRLNTLDILKSEDRQKGVNYLAAIAAKAPVVHFSFAVEPSQQVTEKMVSWFRSNIHPQTLVVVGLTPGIGAGCYLRTTNKVFDFSLKTRLKDNRQSLVNKIKEIIKATPQNP